MDKRAIGNADGVSRICGGPGLWVSTPLSAVAVTDCRPFWEAARLRYRWATPRIVSARPSGSNGALAPLATPPFVMPLWASGGLQPPGFRCSACPQSMAVSQPGSSLRQPPA